MKLQMTPQEALERGFTHEARYWGLPVYIGDLEFAANHPICICTKYKYTDWVFGLLTLVEWLFTPPNAPSRFLVLGPIEVTA